MVVQHNLTAMNSNRMLGVTSKSQAKSTEKLSSGYKINRAADDAAGLSISEKMRKQIRGLTQASNNAQDGISAVQTAEGALTEVHDMLQRMNELAVKAANGTNSSDDRTYIQNEVDQLVSEIDRVAETTKFNETYLLTGDDAAASKNSYAAIHTNNVSGMTFSSIDDTTGIATTTLERGKTYNIDGTNHTILANDGTAVAGQETMAVVIAALDTALDKGNLNANTEAALDNDFGGAAAAAAFTSTDASVKVNITAGSRTVVGDLSLDLHVGADSASTNKINLSIGTMCSGGLGVKNIKVNGSDGTKATAAIDTIKEAIQRVSTQRSSLGAVQNRLEHTINNLDNVVENTTSAEASIRDTDMATEMVKYSNNNILAQAGQSMLAQANQSNQGVLALLQ